MLKQKHKSRPAGVVALATFAFLVAAATLLAAQPVAAATYTVTSTQCEGKGSITEAMTLANNNPGEDTITFRSGLQIEAGQCLPAFGGFGVDYYIVNPTESVVFEGNGAKLAGNIVWITSGGLDTPIGPSAECHSNNENDKLFATTPGFVKVGTPDEDNSAITVTVRDLEMFELNSVARIEKNASLILEDVNLNRIISGYFNCLDSAVSVQAGGNFTARRTVWDEIWNGSDLFLVGTLPAIVGVPDSVGGSFPSAGNLTIEDSIFKNVYKGTVRWDGQIGATVNIVSSRFDVAGGIIVQGDAESNIVNSILSSSVTGAVGLAERLANVSSQDMNIKASTVLIPSVECDGNCQAIGVGLIFTQAAAEQGNMNFIQSAIGVNFPDTLPTPSIELLDPASNFTADAFTWIQPTALQEAAALETLTNQSNLLTASPALRTEGLFTLAEWATPLVPGELIDIVPDADCGQINELINPIDNTCITVDALGNPRVDGNGTRNSGAVQLTEAPRLSVDGVGDGTVDLRWITAKDLDGLCGYRVTYRKKGTMGDKTWDIFDPDKLFYQVTGLMNGIEYEFEVEGLVDCAGGGSPSGFPSNIVTATPQGPHDVDVDRNPTFSQRATSKENKPQYWEREPYSFGDCTKYEFGDDFGSVLDLTNNASALILMSGLVNDVWIGPMAGLYGTVSAKYISHAIVCYDQP